MPDLKEIGAGLTEGLLGGLGQSITQGYRRRQRIEHDTNIAQLQTLVHILHDPDFRGDPEARKEVLGQYFDVLGSMQGGSKGKGGKGKGGQGGGDGSHTDLESTRKFVEGLFSKVYPSGQGRPPIVASTTPGPTMPGQDQGGPVGATPGMSLPVTNEAKSGIAGSPGPFLSPQEKIERVRNESRAKGEGTAQAKAAEVEQEVGIRNRGALNFNSENDKRVRQGVETLKKAGYSDAEAMAMMGVTPPHEAAPVATKPVTLEMKDGSELEADENPRKPGSFVKRVDGTPIDPATVGRVINTSDQAGGELRARIQAKINLNKYPPGDPRHDAAADLLKSYDTKQKGTEVRIVQEQSRANEQSPRNAEDIADGIIRGDLPPDLKGMYRQTAAVEAALGRKGYNLSRARTDWNATQKHLATLNGPQQERLRQAVTFTNDSLPIIEDLYAKWKKLGPTSGFKILNKAALVAASHLPGETGNVANNLLSQINDLTSELGTVYKGGNSSTDETLRLAATNLQGEWNEETFKSAIARIRTNLAIRKNSILNSQPVGVSEGSPYVPKGQGSEGSGSGNERPKPTRPGTMLDADNARKYLTLANGDKDKARAMAKEDNWAVK